MNRRAFLKVAGAASMFGMASMKVEGSTMLFEPLSRATAIDAFPGMGVSLSETGLEEAIITIVNERCSRGLWRSAPKSYCVVTGPKQAFDAATLVRGLNELVVPGFNPLRTKMFDAALDYSIRNLDWWVVASDGRQVYVRGI